jgi:hypothetical protein
MRLLRQTFMWFSERVESAARERANEAVGFGVRRFIVAALFIFLLAFGVRIFIWQDTRLEVGKVQTAVTEGYEQLGRLLLRDGFASFFDSTSAASDPVFSGHPPGYSMLFASVFGVWGDSEAEMQLVQVVGDALAAVLLLAIAAELLPRGVAIIAGVLVALAPQFAYNSVLLLPDSLSVLPILLAIYFLMRALKRPALAWVMAAGACVGVSCWLRANAMLFAPVLAILVVILFARERRWRMAAALVCGALVVVAPLTIRNAVVFHHFIPVSLGAGQTLLEGIADYDVEGKFGIPVTDLEIVRMEAREAGRADYAEALFVPDGVKRERERLARGARVIGAHPVWFGGVMLRRGLSMLRLERVHVVARAAGVMQLPLGRAETKPVWTLAPSELDAGASDVVVASSAKVSMRDDGEALQLVSDAASGASDQFVSKPINVRRGTDYLLRAPIIVEEGSVSLKVVSADRQSLLAESRIIHPMETATPATLQANMIEVAFANDDNDQVRVVLARSNPKAGARTVSDVGRIEMFELGAAHLLWTRYPRVLIHGLQKFFVTAWMLPLAFVGLVLLAWARQYRTLALLLVVPIYYLSVQSILHTEYRYVLAIHYFLFVLVATTLYGFGGLMWQMLKRES